MFTQRNSQLLFAYGRFALLAACAATYLLSTQVAHARLGTFNGNDGYVQPFTSNGYNWADVTYYNAGGFGANAGGGGPAFISADSGKWKLTSNVGGFFPTSVNRATYTSTAPPYPNPNPADTAPSYMVGAHFPGHNSDGNNLAFRNYNPAGTGPAIYTYDLDQYDMGVNPASATISASVEFYFLPNAPEESSNAGGLASDKFTMTFVDGSGSSGFQWGYLKDSNVVWRNSAGPWNYAGIIAEDQSNTSNVWDGVRFNIDFVSDTFSFDYYDVGTNTWSNVVPAGTALANPMTNLTQLKWRLEDNVMGNPFFGKNYFDDFTISGVVPEPSAAGLAILSLVGVLCRRGRCRS